jgi:1-acyl-sn-glycerol-3-phosphate acyltransferase
MRQGDLVCVFPEGTTTDGSKVLPFHANLMQAPVAAGLPVQPVSLSYLDATTGQPSLAPAYIDDITLMECLNAILKSPPIKVRLTVGPQLLAREASRRELAEAAREVVVCLVQGTPDAAANVAERLHQPPLPVPQTATATS